MNSAIQKELEQIRNDHGGVLRPQDVVRFARDENTALHAKFTWDDTEAAHQHRLNQAREVIRVSVKVLPQVNRPVRAYVSLGNDRRSAGGGYRTIESVLHDDDQRAALLREAKSDMRRFKQKYNLLRELAPVFEAMDETLNAETLEPA